MRDGPGRPYGVRAPKGVRGQGTSALRGAALFVLAGAAPAPAAAGSQQRTSAPTSLVFDGVTVVDVEQGKLLPAQRVVITGNRIQAVGGMDAVKTPKDAQVVDAQGKYLIPGLWDMHIHPLHYATDIYYPLLIAYGVTGIRDAGSDVPLDTLIQWRREIVAGTRVGPPRQILSGPYLNYSCGAQLSVCVAQDTARARFLVDSLKAAGADMIKMRTVNKQLYLIVAAESRRLGVPFGGHVQEISSQEASDSGASILDHKGALPDGCWGEEASVEKCRPVAEQFRKNGTWLVPTLVAHGTLGMEEAVGSRGVPAYERFTTQVHQFWGDSVSDTTSSSGAESAADTLGYGYVAQRVGLPLLAGTDPAGSERMSEVPPGFSLHGELAFFVAEGLTTSTALQSATLNPAKLLHGTDSLGTVAPGKLADLVLLDADPLANIANTMRIRAVVANGRYFNRAVLDQILADAKAKAKGKR